MKVTIDQARYDLDELETIGFRFRDLNDAVLFKLACG